MGSWEDSTGDIAQRHHPIWDPVQLCADDRDEWPCDTAVLALRLREAEDTIQRLVDTANSMIDLLTPGQPTINI